jgi:hypothetical protein
MVDDLPFRRNIFQRNESLRTKIPKVGLAKEILTVDLGRNVSAYLSLWNIATEKEAKVES